MSGRTAATQTTVAAPLPITHVGPSLGLQRQCACGGSVGLTGVCQDCRKKKLLGKPLQTKLRISEPGDQYEQEADRVAGQVMRMPDADLNGPRSPSWGPSMQRRATSGATGVMEAPPIVHDVLNSPGQPLDAATRAFFEPRFGHDFSQVRVHAGERAEQSARGVGAHAYTVGHNIVFGAGQFSPDTMEGRGLLAHELTHVLQQGGDTSAAGNPGVQVQRLDAPRLQGSFFGDVWSGIKSLGSAIGRGAAAVGGAIWEGTKAVGGAVWSGLKAVGKWGWNVLKSAGAWVWDLITEAPARIWRLLVHVGSGIVGVVSTLWDAIKGVAGHLWDAVKGVFHWAKEGVEGLFSWIWEGLKRGGQWAWKLLQGDFSGFWEGIGGFFSWLGEGAVRLVKWGREGLVAAALWGWKGAKGVGRWLLDAFLSGAPWVGRLFAKLLDLVGFGEIMDLLLQIIKFNTRPLTSTEVSESKRVFAGSVSYWQVRVDEHSLIAMVGAFFHGGGGMGVTTFHTINFNKNITATPGSNDMGWLVHELTHVWQMEHIGMQYLGEAVHAQATAGYVYAVDDSYANNANGTWLANERAFVGTTFQGFNREQQGDITKHYYMRLSNGLPVGDWQPYIDDLHNA